MKGFRGSVRPLSIALAIGLLAARDATAQDERLRPIDRPVRVAPSAAVSAVPPPPAPLSEAEKLQFLEHVVAQTRSRQITSLTLSRLRSDVLGKAVTLHDDPDVRLTPDAPAALSGSPTAWLMFEHAVAVIPNPTPSASFSDVFSRVAVVLENIQPGKLYLVDYHVQAGPGWVFEIKDYAGSCLINFTNSPMELSISSSGAQHLQAVVEPQQAGGCHLRLREKEGKAWIFYAWEVTEIY